MSVLDNYNFDRQTHKHTDGHGDSMTDTAQRAESVKILILYCCPGSDTGQLTFSGINSFEELNIATLEGLSDAIANCSMNRKTVCFKMTKDSLIFVVAS